jgi:futalosine hydrolase
MSQRILLIAATQQEILPYLQTQHHHDVLITGVGIPSAVFRLTKKLAHHHYDVVIQAGIAGAFENSFAKPGHVVQIVKDAFGDLGAFENGVFTDLQQMNLNYDPTWLNGGNIKTGLPEVSGITVQTITNDKLVLAALSSKWNADVESMEGAAAAYVCQQKHVPFVQLRAISNTIGDRDKSQWKTEEAIANLNNALATFLQNLHV